MEPHDTAPVVHDETGEAQPQNKPVNHGAYSSLHIAFLAVMCIIVGLAIGLIINRYMDQSLAENVVVEPSSSDDPFVTYDEYYGGYETATSSVGLTPREIPVGSAYKIEYDAVYYTDERGDRYVTPHSEAFEYLNEDYVKDNQYVYYRGEAQQWVDPKRCTLEDLSGCRAHNDWQGVVSPYALEVSWAASATAAGDLIPRFSPMCLSEGYKVGEITNGTLAGQPLLVQMDEECGMNCGGLWLLGAYHYVKYGDYTIPVAGDSGFPIKDIATSTRTERIPIPGSSIYLVSEGTFGLSFASTSNRYNRRYLFTDPVVGDIYRDDYACFVSKRPDHVEVAYALELPFAYSRDNGEIPYTQLDGTVNQEVYKAYRDYNSCLNTIDGETFDESQLIKAGEFANGIELYEYADRSSDKLWALYNDPNTLASYQEGRNKYTYEEFIAYKPYLYWKDPFGDWVELLNRRFDVAAEKCKPVIYLYPEREGSFEVKVAPNGGFTETIPEYHDGWNVTATPDSLITDTRTGEQYPYLYWEGVNTGIPKITEGWVVPVGEMESFLINTLGVLGLNEREIRDFNEYWLDRFAREGEQSYKIMFVPQAMFDELAPLTVTGDEVPRTVIRVMMYAQPAQPGETLPLQKLPPTPVRNGFSVVEWGGALLH